MNTKGKKGKKRENQEWKEKKILEKKDSEAEKMGENETYAKLA